MCYCAGLLGFLVMLGRIVLHRIRQASDEQAQLENYKNLAYVDSLTGLFNYTAFKYMKSRWPERTDWTYIVMDINWLKQTNDQYGHRAGDELLCCAARCGPVCGARTTRSASAAMSSRSLRLRRMRTL